MVERRRELAARLRLRHLSYSEISEELAKMDPPCINPLTLLPWSDYTISDDVRETEKLWREDAIADISDLKAKMKAELDEVKRTAWRRGNMDIVLKALRQEAELFGLYAPIKVDMADEIRKIARESGLDEDDAVQEALRILASTK
jgi:hypothetical protein